jgi:hypothetical protein
LSNRTARRAAILDAILTPAGFAKKKNQDFQFYATVRFVQDHFLQ